MTGLYEVELEPEVRSWLAGLSHRDFGRADFLAGLLAEHLRISANLTPATWAARSGN